VGITRKENEFKEGGRFKNVPIFFCFAKLYPNTLENFS
jgi:hypothetical protein